MENPKITVITPVYNTKERLHTCFDSIQNQTFRDFEHLVVSDGSDDGSDEVCAAYAAKYPEQVRFFSLPHGGVSLARNFGLDHARGDWIYFCDSDDKIEKNLLEYLLNLANENQAQVSCAALICESAEGSCDIRTNLPGQGENVWDRKQILEGYIKPLLRLDEKAKETVHGYLPVSLLKREFIEKNGIRFIPDLHYLEDESFMLAYLQFIDRLVFSDKVVYRYIRWEDSATATLFKHKKIDPIRQTKTWMTLAENRWTLYEKNKWNEYFPELRAPLFLEYVFQKAMYDYLTQGSGKDNFKSDIIEFKRLPVYSKIGLFSILSKKQKMILLGLKCGICAFRVMIALVCRRKFK